MGKREAAHTASTGSSRSRITTKGSAKQSACLKRKPVEQRKSAGQQMTHWRVLYNALGGKFNLKTRVLGGRLYQAVHMPDFDGVLGVEEHAS